MTAETLPLFTAAVVLGLIHGIEPGHGWPVAASSALDHSHKWLWGLAASVILGVGHLVSSIAVVLVFFFFQNYFNLHSLNDPVVLPGGIEVAGPIGIGAGILLIGLGAWEYFAGHSHDHEHHEKLPSGVPGLFGAAGAPEKNHDHDDGHDHASTEQIEKKGLWGIAGFAFLLGFIHEEEFEIIGLCAGSNLCLELMLVYAVTVIAGIVGMTLLLMAGFHYFKERVKRIEPYLPHISAGILVVMGIGFIFGLF